ncbi:MAG: RNase J family beta-CASP ribonuclease [DPANN group archaeon]|nr:RNase J family beta-CASP ribonuclease [DPANN group archaeon]
MEKKNQKALKEVKDSKRMITIQAIGGYDEVGKNMTAVTVNGETVLFDMGIQLDNYIKLTEEGDIIKYSPDELIAAEAVPDVTLLGKKALQVKAILPSHAHLDHIGAIPFLARRFKKAGIYGTPFTMSVLNKTLQDEKINLPNRITSVTPNSTVKITKNLKAEFINTTHSTPQSAMIALHTPEGIILYANDFKFDLYPTLGKKPNFERLKELGKKGIRALIVDSTYSRSHMKMPSESVAKQMLKDVMLGTDNRGKGILVTTFSSHIARLKSIIEYGKKLNRKVVFLGRSLTKYTYAAEDIGLVHFSKEVELVRYWKQIKRKLKQVVKDGKQKYVLVVTGHQGEPKSTLSKMVDEKTDYRFGHEDHVIFSCKTIPSPTNIANREYLEQNLKHYGVRIFKDIHVSGHAAREDIRDLINFVRPEHIIPSHGTVEMTSATKELAKEMGYETGKTVHMMHDGTEVRI